MSAIDDSYTTSSQAAGYGLIAFFVFWLLAYLLINIMFAVGKVPREVKRDVEQVPEYAAVQHDTPPPYREVEEPEPGLGIVVVNVDEDYEGDVNLGRS